MKTMSFQLACTCGAVTGMTAPTKPSHMTHAVCYCDDCQMFAHVLGRPTDILDAHGGTRVLQLGQGRVRITKGYEQIRCLKLTAKGLLRFCTVCCKTPIGNVASYWMPAMGIPAIFVKGLREGDPALPVQARVYGRFGHGQLPPDAAQTIFPKDALRAAGFVLGCLLRGEQKGSPFFDPRTRRPIVQPHVIPEGVRRQAFSAVARR